MVAVVGHFGRQLAVVIAVVDHLGRSVVVVGHLGR